MKKKINKKELTQNDLKKILHYDEATGIFTWLERSLDMFQPGNIKIDLSLFGTQDLQERKLDGSGHQKEQRLLI